MKGVTQSDQFIEGEQVWENSLSSDLQIWVLGLEGSVAPREGKEQR